MLDIHSFAPSVPPLLTVMCGAVLFIVVLLSALCCWAFSYFGNPFFVAKPRDWTPERHHQTKQGIPTMGGLVLLTLWIVGSKVDPINIHLPALWLVVSMGLLGAYDDWSKIRRRGGIGAAAKFIAQNLSALIAPSRQVAMAPA